MSANAALYYPFIHIRPQDLKWLKATLLCFPHIYRMVPPGFEVNDAPGIAAYVRTPSEKRPLLRSFNLDNKVVYEIQKLFRNRLQQDESHYGRGAFARFGRKSTRASYKGNDSTFQIHKSKFLAGLLNTFDRMGLAWAPSDPHRGADHNRGAEWVAVHPQLGEALMSTIAAAIASDYDYRVVTSRGRVHRALVTRNPIAAYDTLVRGVWHSGQPDTETVVDELAQVVIATNFHVAHLTAEDIAAVVADGGGLAHFKKALEEFALDVGKLGNEEAREAKLRQAAEKVIDRWHEDQKSGPGAIMKKLMTGGGLIDKAEDFIKTVGKDVVKGAATGAAGAAAGAGVSLTVGPPILLAATAGLALGVVFYAGKTVANHYSRRAKSPFRYLTKVEKRGAAFVIKPPVV